MHLNWSHIFLFFLSLTYPTLINSSLFEPVRLQLNKGAYILPSPEGQVCEARNDEELSISRDCLFINQFQDNSYQCGQDIKPRRYSKKMGKYTCHTYQYNICSTISKNANEDPQIYTKYIIAFTICKGANDDTIYTTHKISKRDFEIESPEFKIPDDFQEKYTSETVTTLYKTLYKSEDYFDTLQPQMLIPSRDISYNIGRGINLEEHNVHLQWKSLNNAWDTINKYIWLMEQLHRKEFQHTIGASGEIKIGKNPVRIGKDAEKRIPKYWWRLIQDKNYHAIVIVMLNQPKGTRSIEKNVCKKNICDESGWSAITKISEREVPWIYCCEANGKLWEALDLPFTFAVTEGVLQLI